MKKRYGASDSIIRAYLDKIFYAKKLETMIHREKKILKLYNILTEEFVVKKEGNIKI